MFLNFWISYVEVIECVSSILFENLNGAFQKDLKLNTVTPSNIMNAIGPFNAELTIINVMALKWVDHNACHPSSPTFEGATKYTDYYVFVCRFHSLLNICS